MIALRALYNLIRRHHWPILDAASPQVKGGKTLLHFGAGTRLLTALAEASLRDRGERCFSSSRCFRRGYLTPENSLDRLEQGPLL